MTPPDNPVDPEREKRKIKSVARMKEIMTAYYIDAKTADQSGKKVAWITSGGPVEPLIAMDIIPVYPENHGAMIGAAKMGTALCEKSEQMGYAIDLCAYARADIACAPTNGGPIGGLPRPDMLICCNNICGTVLKWYEVQARFFDVPLFLLDIPFCHTDFPNESRRYIRKQIDEYIAFLQTVSGVQMDFDRLDEVGRLSIRGQQLWQAVLDTTRHRPAPMSAFDAFFHLALIVTLRGTQVVIDYYGELLAELQERISTGIGAVRKEDHRLLWDNLPIWYRTRWLSEKFAAHNACLVAASYTAAWCSALAYLDETDFLNTMTEAYARIYLNIGIDQMAEQLIQMIDKYDVDGVVMHSNRSCKPYSFGQYDIRKIIADRRGVPTLMLESDMVDQRCFSESQLGNRIDAFMEMLAGESVSKSSLQESK